MSQSSCAPVATNHAVRGSKARKLSDSLGVAPVLLDCSLAFGEAAAEIRWVSSEQIARALKKQDSSLRSRFGAPVHGHHCLQNRNVCPRSLRL